VAADIGFPGHGVYCASKAAVVALMRCLTTDHSPNGVRFVAVSPGTIDTPMLAASCAGWSKPKDEIYADVARKIPIRRMGRPEDVARAVAFLISDEASYINGSVVQLEGGTLALPPW
jgi:NAD(P)-dependent dehydrogenase (short-subunit alcohol dehydrogenase family)